MEWKTPANLNEHFDFLWAGKLHNVGPFQPNPFQPAFSPECIDD